VTKLRFSSHQYSNLTQAKSAGVISLQMSCSKSLFRTNNFWDFVSTLLRIIKLKYNLKLRTKNRRKKSPWENLKEC